MSAERATYVDSSALVKLAVREPESTALRRYLVVAGRSCQALSPGPRSSARSFPWGPTRSARPRCARPDRPPAHQRSRPRCGRTPAPADLRSLDAIHLASAEQLGSDLGGFVTYDERLATARSRPRVPGDPTGLTAEADRGRTAVEVSRDSRLEADECPSPRQGSDGQVVAIEMTPGGCCRPSSDSARHDPLRRSGDTNDLLGNPAFSGDDSTVGKIPPISIPRRWRREDGVEWIGRGRYDDSTGLEVSAMRRADDPRPARRRRPVKPEIRVSPPHRFDERSPRRRCRWTGGHVGRDDVRPRERTAAPVSRRSRACRRRRSPLCLGEREEVDVLRHGDMPGRRSSTPTGRSTSPDRCDTCSGPNMYSAAARSISAWAPAERNRQRTPQPASRRAARRRLGSSARTGAGTVRPARGLLSAEQEIVEDQTQKMRGVLRPARHPEVDLADDLKP